MSITNLNAAQLKIISDLNRSLPSAYSLHCAYDFDLLVITVYGRDDPIFGRPLLAEITFDEENQLFILEYRKATAVQKEIITTGISLATSLPVYQV